MEQIAHVLIFLTTSGVGLILVQVGRFLQKQRTMDEKLEAMLAAQKEMNGNVRSVTETVLLLPCEVEKRDRACPGGHTG